MSERQGKTDFDVLIELIAGIAPALISIDPGQEWTAEEIAEMAVDQAQAIQLELKRRKKNERENQRENQASHNKPADTRPEAPMPGIGPGINRERVRRMLEGQG
jgi:hypothetical protein